MTQTCVVHRMGVVEYETAWHMQAELANQVAKQKRPPTLLLLEHPHTYTFGRSGHAENLLWDETELARRQVKVIWVDRGGDVTYHGPGQLVGYPLLPLAPGGLRPDGDSTRIPRADFIGYIRRLEETLILALSRLGVMAFRMDGMTGVWVKDPHALSAGARPAKIASIGVKVDVRGVSRHGFALNVSPDMHYWDGIVGCGLAGYPVTSLTELLTPPPTEEVVIRSVLEAFSQVYHYRLIEEVL
jgi:lipoate-protein ligase B